MAPTLSPGAHERGEHDWVIINRWFPTRSLKRGDVITFWKPHRPDEVSIKRVVGLEGDTIYPSRGYATESHTYKGKRVGTNDGLPGEENLEGKEEGKVIVPYGHVWVEGDNWRKSYDSCDFGPISKSLIDGRAVRVWRGGWWKGIEDGREKGRGSKVVEGRSEIPELFLE
jgi:mitochondrial inner membrane protease subunit 2